MQEPTSIVSDYGSPIFSNGLDAFLDTPVRIHAELGRTRVRIREFLSLTADSVLELPVSEGEYIRVFVNGKLVAHGEIIVVEGTVAVRITEVAC